MQYSFGEDDDDDFDLELLNDTEGDGDGSNKECTGRWTREEHQLFIKGLELYGKGWKKIASLIKTRTVVQIRTHAQKYFLKLSKARQNGELGGGFGLDGRPFPGMRRRKKRRTDRPISLAPALVPFVKITPQAATDTAATNDNNNNNNNTNPSNEMVEEHPLDLDLSFHGPGDGPGNHGLLLDLALPPLPPSAPPHYTTIDGDKVEIVDLDDGLYHFLSPAILPAPNPAPPHTQSTGQQTAPTPVHTTATVDPNNHHPYHPILTYSFTNAKGSRGHNAALAQPQPPPSSSSSSSSSSTMIPHNLAALTSASSSSSSSTCPILTIPLETITRQDFRKVKTPRWIAKGQALETLLRDSEMLDWSTELASILPLASSTGNKGGGLSIGGGSATISGGGQGGGGHGNGHHQGKASSSSSRGTGGSSARQQPRQASSSSRQQPAAQPRHNSHSHNNGSGGGGIGYNNNQQQQLQQQQSKQQTMSFPSSNHHSSNLYQPLLPLQTGVDLSSHSTSSMDLSHLQLR